MCIYVFFSKDMKLSKCTYELKINYLFQITCLAQALIIEISLKKKKKRTMMTNLFQTSCLAEHLKDKNHKCIIGKKRKLLVREQVCLCV